VAEQLMDKLQCHQSHIDEISFDDVADVPSELKSRWQQLSQFEDIFEVG